MFIINIIRLLLYFVIWFVVLITVIVFCDQIRYFILAFVIVFYDYWSDQLFWQLVMVMIRSDFTKKFFTVYTVFVGDEITVNSTHVINGWKVPHSVRLRELFFYNVFINYCTGFGRFIQHLCCIIIPCVHCPSAVLCHLKGTHFLKWYFELIVFGWICAEQCRMLNTMRGMGLTVF